MANLPFAKRLLSGASVRRLRSAGQFLNERLIARPLQFARPYLKKGLVMRPLLFSFIVIGCVLIFMGVREYNRTSPAARAAAVAAATEAARPQAIAYKDLAAKGPGDNAYVRLTDFDFTDHYTNRKGKGGGWE